MARPWHFVFEDAVRDSDLDAKERLVLFVLRTYADGQTGHVSQRHAPSLKGLARGTGLSRSTVADRINTLESKGWLTRISPSTKDAISKNATNAYILHIPTEQKSAPGPTAGRGETCAAPGPTAGRGVAREWDGGSPGAGHRTDQTDLGHCADQRSSSPTAMVIAPADAIAPAIGQASGLDAWEA